MHIESNNGKTIRTVAEWPPVSDRHWCPYRGACELAHAWTERKADETFGEPFSRSSATG